MDDILNINNVYFDNMVGQVCPSGLQLGEAGASGAEAAFFDLHLSISNDVVSTRICDRRGGFGFEVVDYPFLVVFLVLHPVGSVSLGSFVLLEHLAMLLTSTLAINC